MSLGDRGIATSDQEKTMAAGAQMRQSKMFTEDKMVGKQDVGDTNVGGIPGILHRKVAGAEAVFFHHGKAIAIQRSSAPSPPLNDQ